MPDPVLYVIAGPNGAGKTTFYNRVLRPVTHLPFVNADLIAAELDPAGGPGAAYEAAGVAAADRAHRIASGQSFATETLFSHPSKLALLEGARDAGYRIHLHVIVVPVELAVARVALRAAQGGHDVPEEKVRARYIRLFDLVAAGIHVTDETRVYDNSRATTPFRTVATFLDGELVAGARWPAWLPAALRGTGR